MTVEIVARNRTGLLCTAALAVALAVVAAGCAGAGATPTAAPSAAGTIASTLPGSSPSAEAPKPTLMNPAPAEMLGQWTVKFAEGDVATITISPTGIKIVRFGSANVRLEVFGDELVLSHSQLCTGEGRYAWTIDDDKLRFDSVTPDACDGRAKSFDGVTYTRVKG
jgi:hypothetical protein